MATAIVLSAGFGTRLRPLTNDLAKPLMPVGDRPLLAHLVDALERAGVTRIVANVHHRAADFDGELRSWLAKVHVVREDRILGTAGGIAHARDALGPGDVFVWNGDILAPDLEVARLLEERARAGTDLLWAVAPRPLLVGTVGLAADGSVVRLRDERFGTEVMGGDFIGVQVLGERLRSELPLEGCMVADVALPLLRRGERIASSLYRGAWDDVGTPEALLRANLNWLARRNLTSWMAPDAHIDPGVRLNRVVVGAGAVVSGEGWIEEGVVFPHAKLHASARRILAGPGERVDL